MSAHNNHVENSTWLRAVMMAGVFLTVGVIAFAALGVGVANQKHDVYDEAKYQYYEAKEDPLATQDDLADLKHDYEKSHHTFLTYRVAGLTILVMCFIYASFLGVGGLFNSQ